jgi:hypothetical protein
LEIKNGAKVEGLLVQAARGSADQPAGTGKGKIHVEGQDSTLQCEQLFIGGGRANLQKSNTPVRDGIGEMRITGGGSTAVEEFAIFGASSLFIGASSKLSVSPKGASPTPAVIFAPESTLEIILEPSGAQAPIRVTGQVQINGAALRISAAAKNAQKSIPIIDYNGGSLSGTFQDLADGGEVKASDGRVYSIDYGLKGTNIVTLNLK